MTPDRIDLLDTRRHVVRAQRAIVANETAIKDHVAGARIARARRSELKQRLRTVQARLKEMQP